MLQTTPGTVQGAILVVDDTPANLQVLNKILVAQGYKVRPAISGELALASVRASLPDLILLDILMPEMDGYEVCKRLKADPRTQAIPVLFISALSDVFDKVQAFNAGGVDYICKPFQAEEVLARVDTHLKLHHLQRQLAARNAELQDALEALKTAQAELVQKEKMAALGQLIAGIAHEINTPLGAIYSAAGGIEEFCQHDLHRLLKQICLLSPQGQEHLENLLGKADFQEKYLSSREKRQIRKELAQRIAAQDLPGAEHIAAQLLALGLERELGAWLPLLRSPEGPVMLDLAEHLAALWKSAHTIHTAAARTAKVIKSLKTFARYDAAAGKIEADLREGVENVLTLYQYQLKHGVEVIKRYQPVPPIACYPDELAQVWMNLIHNALQAMDNKGTLDIAIARLDDTVQVSVGDTGPGIPEAIRDKIFQPFFTTKPMGEGSGLGLDIVKKIVEKHAGRIEVQSRPGHTRFCVSLPLA